MSGSNPAFSPWVNTMLSLSTAVPLEHQGAGDFFLLFLINKLIFIGAELLYNIALVLLYSKVNHLFAYVYPLFCFFFGFLSYLGQP